jgi:hypothetical protein
MRMWRADRVAIFPSAPMPGARGVGTEARDRVSPAMTIARPYKPGYRTASKGVLAFQAFGLPSPVFEKEGRQNVW